MLKQLIRQPTRWLTGLCLCAFFAVMLVAPPTDAFVPPESSGMALPSARHVVVAQELQVEPATQAPINLRDVTGQRRGAADFMQRHPGEWEISWDVRSDRPGLISGSGIALVPGRGNQLSASDIGLARDQRPDFATVTTLLEDFIQANADLLGVQGLEFVPDTQVTDPFGPERTHWFVEFRQVKNGVPVEGAHLFFRIAAGNIVQFGTYRVAPVNVTTRPDVGVKQAFNQAFKQLEFPQGTEVSEWLDEGTLQVRVWQPEVDAGPGHAFLGSAGQGYDHRLVWHFKFRVDDDRTTYAILVDAGNGQLLDARDTNTYATATVSGGVYPPGARNIPGTEVIVPFPYTNVSNSGTKVTNVNGQYDYAGGTATTTLNGKYIRIQEHSGGGCSSPSLSNSTTGNLELGTSGGTDCTRPSNNSSTHAARNAFYYLTEVNRQAASYYPSNSWLNGTVNAVVNENDTCNAYWNGSELHFFKSGAYGSMVCANTGELSGVFMHEFGHGIQQKVGGSPNDMGTGEATGDTFAFLQIRDGCIGDGFITNSSAACTGVRDVSEYAVHGGTGFVLKPSNINASGGPNCGQYGCPYYANGFQPYMGPMGYEGHCEALIAGSANWDLAQELVGALGVEPGWQKMTDLWYHILPQNKAAYRVESGGQCNTSAVVNGCGSNNWYNLYLAADDDDGNLSNGTPNACRIWDAFNAHGIACGARPMCSTQDPGMTLELTPPSGGVCRPGNVTYTVDTTALGNPPLTNSITLAAGSLPGGVTASFSPNPVSPGSSSTLTLAASASATPGTSSFNITGSATGADSKTVNGTINIAAGVPVAPNLSLPASGATNVSTPVAFSWTASANADGYLLEVATDAGFTTIVNTQNVTGTSASASLTPATTYYWRVTASNSCGNGTASTVRSFTTATAPFPAPYCSVSFPSNVEPISRVTFADIDNSSSAVKNGSPALEDFTAIVGHVTRGESLPIVVKGNTDGSYTNKIRVYIDWNQDGDFNDAGEVFNLSDLTNSTGTDSKQSTGTIAIPATAPLGQTRMRVIKKWNSAADPCNTSGYGQAEDYTLVVGAGSVTYTVTPSVGTPAGTINPSTPQSVSAGATKSFTLVPNTGHVIDNVGGTCGGSLAGAIYTTSAVNSNCTVIANFKAVSVVSDPLASVSPASLSFSVAADATASEALTIANASGRDPLTFAIASRAHLLQPVNSTREQRATTTLRSGPKPAMSVNVAVPNQPQATYNFQWDDGSSETSVGDGNDNGSGGLADSVAAVWLNRFAVSEAVTIDSISILWPTNTSGTLVGLQPNLVAYYDADADGDPANAVRIGGDHFVDITTLDVFETYTTSFDIPGAGDIYVGFVDQWALAGGYTPALFPAAMDTSSPSQGMSWVASAAGTPPVDIDNLGNNPDLGVIDDFGIPGNWLIRATGVTAIASGCTGPVIGWLETSPTSGTVAGGTSTNVTITVDPVSASLAVGHHDAELCIATNDPTQAQIIVPVSVEVTPAATPTYTVTAIANGNGDIQPPTRTVAEGATTTFTVTPDLGYHIDTVSGCGGTLSGNTYTTGATTADCTVTASFAINAYTVTTSVPGGHGSFTPSSQTVNHGSTTSFAVNPEAGYHVVSVSGCGGTLADTTYTTGPITADCTVTASFALNDYTVTAAVASGHGSITPPLQVVGHGGIANFTLTPDVGYLVISVSGDACAVTGSDTTWSAADIQADCEVTATFGAPDIFEDDFED